MDMDSWMIPGVVGGIMGGVVAAMVVTHMNQKVRANPCPHCGQPLTGKKPGKRTWTQVIWGGWICPDCGCDVDRFGKERADT
jgi:hypothetical protein